MEKDKTEIKRLRGWLKQIACRQTNRGPGADSVDMRAWACSALASSNEPAAMVGSWWCYWTGVLSDKPLPDGWSTVRNWGGVDPSPPTCGHCEATHSEDNPVVTYPDGDTSCERCIGGDEREQAERMVDAMERARDNALDERDDAYAALRAVATTGCDCDCGGTASGAKDHSPSCPHVATIRKARKQGESRLSDVPGYKPECLNCGDRNSGCPPGCEHLGQSPYQGDGLDEVEALENFKALLEEHIPEGGRNAGDTLDCLNRREKMSMSAWINPHLYDHLESERNKRREMERLQRAGIESMKMLERLAAGASAKAREALERLSALETVGKGATSDDGAKGDPEPPHSKRSSRFGPPCGSCGRGDAEEDLFFEFSSVLPVLLSQEEKAFILTWAESSGKDVSRWVWEAAQEKAELDSWCPEEKG